MTALLIVTIIIIFCIVLLIIYMFSQAFKNTVKEITMEFDDFPESFLELKLFFITDIHKRKISDGLLNKINTNVDLVLIGGDLTEKNVPFERVEKNIQKLKSLRAPIYFVWGNNDYETDYRTLDAILLQNGVKILDNTSVMFESREGEIVELLGVDDVSVQRANVSLALSDCHPHSFKILAAHNPLVARKFSEEENIALVLSGHTHGGQIRILGFGPYEVGKLHHLAHTKLFVSNGYGTTFLPLRLGAPAETHIITLKRG